MVGVPRSQRLIAHNFTTAGISSVWSSPAGYVTLVKSAVAFNTGATVANVSMQFYPAGQSWAVSTPLMSLAEGQSGSWEGFVVLNPGDAVLVQSSVSGVTVWVSGAVLAGPNQFPPATREQVNVLPAAAE